VVAKFWGFESDIVLSLLAPPENCSIPSGQSPGHHRPWSLSASLEHGKHLMALSQALGNTEMPREMPTLPATPCCLQHVHHSESWESCCIDFRTTGLSHFSSAPPR
ncbi:Metal Transporter Cnnm4, partial [Manis pentadactyla]